jgi:tetratricopeptide (TPR) repeat protein
MAALLIAWCLAAPLGAQDPLSAAQALYADARYEEALKAFDTLKAAGGQPLRTALAIEQGRAFCLLALDRGADAQQAIEAMLRLDPSFKLSADETPPKIRNVFRDVRRRALAGVLQEVYERAKQAYERKAYDEAVVGFGKVLALLDDPDLVLDAGPRADMRLVAKAFEDLAKAASPPPPSTPPSGSPAAAGAAAADAPATPRGGAVPAGARGGASTEPLYDGASKDVTAPVPERTDFRIPDSLRRSLPTGDVVVELIVSAAGTVESVTVRQAPDAVFGALIARAAMDWRYRPASKAGKPVRYRLMTKVVVSK